MIRVLIVEDDPMVAELNRQYVNKVSGFTVIGHAPNPTIALELLTKTKVDLLLLDIHMPGMGGLDFLRRLREEKEDIDVILITAASEMTQIQQALRLGAIDYLIKPFEFSRFQESLMQYKTDYDHLEQKDKISQQELDRMLRKKNKPLQSEGVIPKGLTKTTLKRIIELTAQAKVTTFSTEDIAEISNISRVSVRKYLKFLTEIDYLEEHLVYGIGRPIYQYQVKKSNHHLLTPYL